MCFGEPIPILAYTDGALGGRSRCFRRPWLCLSWDDEKKQQLHGLNPANGIAAAGDEYLTGLRESGKAESYTRYARVCLARASDFFDMVQAKTPEERKRCRGSRNLARISPPDVRAFVRWLATNPRGTPR